MVKVLRVSIAAVLFCAAATTSQAQVTRFGATTVGIAIATRGSNVAYDSVNQVYLAVSTATFGGGAVRGRFIDKTGLPLGTPFLIQASANPTHFPAVAFSKDADGGAGGFLVVWHESDLVVGTSIHTRVVSFGKSGPAGSDNVVSVDGAYWERYPAVAYSTKSREFLVTYPRVIRGIRGVRVDLNGAQLGPPFTIAATGQFEEWSSAVYNPTNDQFVSLYEGYNDPGRFGYMEVRAIQAGSGALLGAGPTRIHQGGSSFINEIVYLPDTNQYLACWYNAGAFIATLCRVLSADLTPGAAAAPVSTFWKSYDGLGLAYNPLTQSSFMVAHDGVSRIAFEDGGVEIDVTGKPKDATGIFVTSSPDSKANFYPKVAASTDDPNWLVVTSHNFVYTATQLLSGTGVAPPAPKENPLMFVDGPGPGTVTQPFDVQGWAIDLGASAGTGADAIHVWAWPAVGGPPIFVGATTPSVARSDIGAIFGARFTNSGYKLTVGSLAGGNYLLAIYMHSTVTGTFNAVRTVAISVSTPLLSIDTPSPNAVVSSSGFFVGGWAIDLASTSGSGISAIHAWAFPVGGGSPIFAGVGTYGVARPDLGGIFGAQFTNAGFDLTVTTLPPGTYDLALFSQSSVTGTFNAVRVVRVVVVQ
jgi:hypothetical protein